MKLIEILRRSFVVLALSFMAVGMLSACSSSEEEPPPAEGGGNEAGYDMCMENCIMSPDECEAHCSGVYL